MPTTLPEVPIRQGGEHKVKKHIILNVALYSNKKTLDRAALFQYLPAILPRLAEATSPVVLLLLSSGDLKLAGG